MASVSVRVNSGNDNGYYGGGWNINSSLSIGRAYIGTEGYGSFRWTGVNVPQGTTITSATLTMRANTNSSATINVNFHGIDEDNTANLSSDPDGRSKTTNYNNYQKTGVTLNNDYDIDVTAAVQEVINRGGWASGNALALITNDNGTSNDNALGYKGYSTIIPGDQAYAPLITIVWAAASSSLSPSLSPSKSPSLSPSTTPPPGSASPSLSPSISVSRSVSKSPSVSESLSPSLSPSTSVSSSVSKSYSPSPAIAFLGLKIGKPGINVLKTNDPNEEIFDSDYETLKYFMEGNISMSDTADPFTTTTKTVTVDHNLNYFPFHVAYVSNNNTTYYPQSYAELGSGANLFISTQLTKTQLILHMQIENNSASPLTANAYCYYKIYKNDLNL